MSQAADAMLKRTLHGSLLRPDNEEYSDARRIF